MADLDLLLRDVRVPRAALAEPGAGEGEWLELDVGVAAGHVAALGQGLSSAREVVEGAGRMLLPGLIDNHVHYREPGAAWKEGYVTGSAASARGGATTVGEIQNNPPLVTTAARWHAKMDSVRRRSAVRVLAYGNGLRSNVADLGELAAVAPGIKVFLAGDAELEVNHEEHLRPVFEEVARAGGLLIVHAEDGDLVRRGVALHGDAAGDWSRARSVHAELVAVERVLELARECGTRLHVFHVSSAAACEEIRAARQDGLAVSASTCPHYLLFTDEDVAARGAVLKCNPSIKSATDRAALRAALADGTLDVFSSDHAPHPAAGKEGPFRAAPSGIPSADLLLPLLFHLVDEGVLTVEQAVARACTGPADLFRLHDRGRIAPGAPADLVLVDDARWATVSTDCFASRGRCSPYLGWRLRCWPWQTFVGGRCVFHRDHPEDLEALERSLPPPLPGVDGSGCC